MMANKLQRGLARYRTVLGYARYRMVSGFAPILVVLILGIIGVVAYLMLNPQSLNLYPSPTPTQISDPTASWKKYTSQLGYSFEYPGDWDLKNFGEIDSVHLDFVALDPNKIESEFSVINISLYSLSYERTLERRSHYTRIEEVPIEVSGRQGIRETGISQGGGEFVAVILPFGRESI